MLAAVFAIIALGLASAQLYEPDSPTVTSLYANDIDVRCLFSHWG